MRTVKILASLAGGLIVLIVAGLLALWLLVNPNDYKGRIAAAVKESTGRDLVLQGDIELSVFPWIALELGPATLGNPPGFGEGPFLAFNRAAVRVRLFPLLAKRLEMDRVEIDGLDLRLRKNAQGAGNWENFGRADRPAKSTGGEEGRGQSPELAGVRITHGRISYQAIVLDKFNLETGALGGQGVTPFSISFDASRGVPGENLTLNGQFDLSADPQSKQLRLAEVSFGGLVGRHGNGSAPWEMSAPAIEVDLAGQSVAAPAFAASYANARISGRLQATKILEDLEATGSLTLAPVVLREFAPRLGIVLPQDPRSPSAGAVLGEQRFQLWPERCAVGADAGAAR